MMNKPQVCLTIAGLDPSGGAGIIADIKTFSAFGCFAAAAVASITFQNTTGVFGSLSQSGETIRRQVEPIAEDYEISAVKTGMLPTLEAIEETARLVQKFEMPNVVVDPVVRSTSGYDLIDDDALRALVRLMFPLSDIITPNIPEAERISGIKIDSVEKIHEAARAMLSMNARAVLIKGGHFRDAPATDHLFLGDQVHIFEGRFVDTNATHGTGCSLAAAIAANLARGVDIIGSVATAKEFVAEAIRTAPVLGKGHSPINIQPFKG